MTYCLELVVAHEILHEHYGAVTAGLLTDYTL